MTKYLKVNYGGNEYIWDGNEWYSSDFIRAPKSIIPKLTGLISDKERLILRKEIAEERRKNLIIAHKNFLFSKKLPYDGIRTAASNHHRITHCYNCKKGLDNSEDVECNICGWIVCSCGACGCGYSGF